MEAVTRGRCGPTLWEQVLKKAGGGQGGEERGLAQGWGPGPSWLG